MKRWYIFLLTGSWRTRDIEAHTLQQAYRIAKKEYDNVVYSTYQTCPLSGMMFSGWKEMRSIGGLWTHTGKKGGKKK